MKDALARTVQDIPKPEEYRQNMVLYFNTTPNQDIFEPWDGNTVRRDQQLAKFWKSEPFLASAVTSIATTRAALSWELSGPPKTVAKTQKLLNNADFGQGWQHLAMKVAIDLSTSDSGAFIEVIRKPPPRGRRPESMPVIGLNHLPAIQCIRTGNPIEPVIYIDRKNKEHTLKWYQVVTLAENPIPEDRFGRQFCFVSRVLKFAQIIKDIEQHHYEKVGGRFNKAIHVVSGVSQAEMETIRENSQLNADNSGLLAYGEPIILTTLDPNAKVSKETLELASLPDGFDLDQMMNWYITLFAMASGSDYQEFAPLSSGNLGTASQSDTLHRKAQRKGTQLFIKIIETALTQAKVIPPTVAFRFRQQDAQAEKEQVEIQSDRINNRKIQIDSGEITPAIAQQMAVDVGDLKQEYLVAMGQVDQTPNITLGDDETLAEELLDLDSKHFIGNWFRTLVENHPLQAISPISDAKLHTFVQNVRNSRFGTSVGTSEAWLSPVLVKAAQNAGIDPVALRKRLPNEYEIYITEKGLIDSKEQLLKPRLVKARKEIVVDYANPLLDNFTIQFNKAVTEGEKLGVAFKFAREIFKQYGGTQKEMSELMQDIEILIKHNLPVEIINIRLLALTM